jgi:3-hydroxyacyl-CoA dehydrogenase
LSVRIWDPHATSGQLRERILANAREVGGISIEQLDSQLYIAETAREAVENAAFVQESGPEDLETKAALYSDVAQSLGLDAILASSTSTLMPSLLQEQCPFADRMLVGHPFNPPHIIPIVEIVAGRRTSPHVVERAFQFYESLGQRPIRLGAERPGHLANRLQAALWREALHAVESGLATIADVDAVVSQSIGPRWALMGPFLTFHLGGGEGGLAHFLDHIGPSFEALWKDLKSPDMSRFHEVVEDQMAQRISAAVKPLESWRDEFLVEILRLSSAAEANLKGR